MKKNVGSISKKKVAKEIAMVYKNHNPKKQSEDTREVFMDYGACSALNALCGRLGIKPMHLNKELGAGTGEMLENEVENE